MAAKVLDELEARVREAVERLRTLQEQNARLSERISELEEQLADADSGEAAAWEKEREEVRRRVEGLTRTLADLLEE